MSAVVSRSFFSKKITRSSIGKLPSTADILIQTDDSANMADFKNWATDPAVLLDLNDALEEENVGSTSLGAQYFNRFATATLTDAKVIPSVDWLGRNLGSVGGDGDASQTWIRKDFIDKFNVLVSGVLLVPDDGVSGAIAGYRHVLSNLVVGVVQTAQIAAPILQDQIQIILGENDPTEYIVQHEPATSGGTGATFRVVLGLNYEEDQDGNQQPSGSMSPTSVSIVTSGSGYAQGENLTIKGSQFGGRDGDDDLYVNGVQLTGYNITIERSELNNSGLTLSDYIVSSVFQNSVVNFIEENANSSEFYNVFLSAAPQTQINVGDEITFERGVNSLWSKLNTSTGTRNAEYYKQLERNSINVNVVSATSGDAIYSKYTRSIKIQTDQDLSVLIPNPKNEEYSFYTQVYNPNFEGDLKYRWDSTPITGYNKIATKISSEGTTYYEYYINFKYPSRLSIDQNNTLQYAIIYKNLLKGLSSSFVLDTIPNVGLEVRFRGVYTSIGFDFFISNITADDVNSTSTNYLDHVTIGRSSSAYLWTNTDINEINYPSSITLNIPFVNYRWFAASYPITYNPSSPISQYPVNLTIATSFFSYNSSLSGDISTIRNKDRIAVSIFTNSLGSSIGVSTNADGAESLTVANPYSYNFYLGTDGENSTTPIILADFYPLGGVTLPQLMSDISSGGVTQNIILANLETDVQAISWNERIGTTEPVLTTTKTKYWKKVWIYGNTDSTWQTGPTTSYSLTPYIRIDDEIIKFQGYTKISENRYELTGVVRGQFGTTPVAHTGFESSNIVNPVRPVLDISEQSNTVFNSDGSFNPSTSSRFYWRQGSVQIDPQYLNIDGYCTIGKPVSDKSNRFSYQVPLYGPCNFFINQIYQREVISVNQVNNSIKFNEVGGLSPTMRITGLFGLDNNGDGNGAKISKIDFIDNIVYLESAGNIFDPNVSEGSMVGGVAQFSFVDTIGGRIPYIALFGTSKQNGGYDKNTTAFYSSYNIQSVVQRYYLEPYPIGNRAYEDLYGAAYQAFISARNNTSGIADDDNTYFTPRSQTETFLIQASRDQFFSNESVSSSRAKYLYEPITDGETIVLNDSSGIGVSDTIYGPGLPLDGAVIWSLEQYSPKYPRIFDPGTITVTTWGQSNGISYAYFFVPSSVTNRDKITSGGIVKISTFGDEEFIISRVFQYSFGTYVYLNPNPIWSTYISNASFTIGSGYYSPVKVKVRTPRQVYRDIIIYEYNLASFGGQSCARFKLKKSDIGNLQANVSHVSQITNDYFNPAYEDDTTIVFYDGSDYTAPVIGFENHPTETEYYYVYVNNLSLVQPETVENYDTFAKGIPSVLEIVNIRKIKDLSSDPPVNTEYLIDPIPNLNKNTRYSQDNGKVVWFSTAWNRGDVELNTYYVPDQYDPSVFWNLDKDEEARYFHVASADQKTYTIQESNGTNLLQSGTNSLIFPTLSIGVGNGIYFTNIPPELSTILNADTVYYVTAANSVSTRDLSISTEKNGTSISFPTGSGYNLKARVAQKLFQEFEATTSQNTLSFSNPASGIVFGQRVYGPGITSPEFRTIIDVIRNVDSLAVQVILDSNVNNPRNQPEIFQITGFNKIKTQDTFTQAPENLDEFLVPPSGQVVIGNELVSYTEVQFDNNSYTFTVPVNQYNTFFIKPQTKIAVKYPRLTTELSINSSDTKIEILANPVIPKRFYKLVIFETQTPFYTITAFSEIKLYYDGVEVPYTNATISGPGTSNEFNQSTLNLLINGITESEVIYDFNHGANGSTSYIIEFQDPVLVDGFSLWRGGTFLGIFPSKFEMFVSENGTDYIRVSTETYSATNSINETTGILPMVPEAIDPSYPQFGNIKINNEIIYYGYRTNKYFGDCIIKEPHSSGSIVSFSPYNAIKENSIIYNGMDELSNVRVVVTDTYPPNPLAAVQIKVAGLEVDNPFINIALSSNHATTKQFNENIIFSEKIDSTKTCTYINDTTLELEAGSIITELVNGDELLIQTSYALGPGYKVSLLKDGKSFYINKPTTNTSVSNNEGTPFRKMYIVDSEILSGLNDGIITAANKFNNGKGFKYIPLSGCLDIKPVKCLFSKYISFASKKYSKTMYLSDKILDPETLTGLSPKYDEFGNKTTGNYILSFEGNDYEIESIEYPDAGGDAQILSNFITNFQHINPSGTFQQSTCGIDIDSVGNIYVLNTENQGSNNTGDRAFVTKYDVNGEVIWSRAIENTFKFDYRPEGLKIYNNEIFCLLRCITDNSIHIMKFNTDGVKLADKKISSGGTEIPRGGFEFDTNGDIWITGTTQFSGVFPADWTVSTTPTVGNNYNGYWELSLPWSVNFQGRLHNTAYVSTKGAIIFGAYDPAAITNMTNISPAEDKLYFGCRSSYSCQTIRYGITGTTPNRVYHIVYEGTTSSSGAVGSPNKLHEIRFYENTNNLIHISTDTNNQTSSSGGNSADGGGAFSFEGERISSMSQQSGGSHFSIELPTSVNTSGWRFALHSLFNGHDNQNSGYSIVNGKDLRMCHYNTSYQSNNFYSENKYAWNRPFSISFNVEMSDPNNNTQSGAFGIGWTKQNDKHGEYYYFSKHISSLFEYASFVFTGNVWRDTSNTVRYYKTTGGSTVNPQEQQAIDLTVLSGTAPFVGVKQNVFYWMDYNPSTSQMQIYYDKTNVKPASPQHTFTIQPFDANEYYFSIFAGGYYVPTYMDNIDLKEINVTFTDNNQVVWNYNDFNFLTGQHGILDRISTGMTKTGSYAGGLICKVDNALSSILDNKTIGSSSSQWEIKDIKFDSAGNKILLINIYGQFSSVYKYDLNNNLVWQKTYNQFDVSYNASEIVCALQVDNNNNIYVLGYEYGGNSTTNTYKLYYTVVYKLDSSGVYQWGKVFDGNISNEFPRGGMDIDKATGTVTVYGLTYSGRTGTDLFIFQLDTNGNTILTKEFGSIVVDDLLTDTKSENQSLKVYNNVAYFTGTTYQGNTTRGGLFGSLNLSSIEEDINGPYGPTGSFTVINSDPNVFSITDLPLQLGRTEPTTLSYGTPAQNTSSFLSITNTSNTDYDAKDQLAYTTNTFGTVVDLTKKYIKVNLTTPLKIATKLKDTVIVKSQDYTTEYERVPNVRGLVYGPQKAVLFDNYKSLIPGTITSNNYLYTINKDLKTKSSFSEVGNILSFVILSDVTYLHDEECFVEGAGIAPGTKVKSINYFDKVVYLTQALTGPVSGVITFYVRRFKYLVPLESGTTENISVGDTVSFIISLSSFDPINIVSSSRKYYVGNIISNTLLEILSLFSTGGSFNATAMYVASSDGFSTRDFEIGAIELGGFKNNQRQQIVNTSIIADGTDGAIFDIETVQTRATREMFTKSIGTTLGRFVFKQRNFISKNRPIYWSEIPTNQQPIFDGKVEYITSGLYLDRPVFFSFSGSKIYWSFDAENWLDRTFTSQVTYLSFHKETSNLFISFNNGTFKSIALSDIALGSGIDYTLPLATTIKFIKRIGSYTFIQGDNGVFYTAINPSSVSADAITWNSIEVGNTNTVIDAQFDDYNYVIIFDQISSTNFYKNYVLSNITGANININVISDRIKGYNNVFTPIKTTSIAYGLGKFVEAGYRVLFQGVYQNPFIEIYEYENFSDITSPDSTAQFDVKSITYNDGQFVCAGFNTVTNRQFIRYSPNARVWYDVDLYRDKIIPVTEIIAGQDYIISSVGSTNWIGIGASTDLVGTKFTANVTTPIGDGTVIDLSFNLISEDEEITAIEYGGFNTYIAAVQDKITLAVRFIKSNIPLPSTINLTPEQYDINNGTFKILETAGNTTLYRFKSSVLDGNLLAWDGSRLVYFKYESGAPVETNELNDYIVIGCQPCTYYEYNGLVLPDFRTGPEQIGTITDPADPNFGSPIFTSAPLSLFEEGLIAPRIIYPGSGYEPLTTFVNCQVSSEFGLDARINLSTNENGEIDNVTVINNGRFYSNLSELQNGLIVPNNTGVDGNGVLNNAPYEEGVLDERAIIGFENTVYNKQYSVYGAQAGTNGYAVLYKNLLNSSLYYIMFFDNDGVFLDSNNTIFISDIAHLSSEFAFDQGL